MTNNITRNFAIRDGITPQLDYHGGKLLDNPSFVSIYYGNYWQTIRGKSQKTFLDKFADQIVKGPHTSIWEQYGINKGQFKGSVNATPLKELKQIDNFKVQQIIKQEIEKKKFTTADKQTVYTLFLPPNTVLIADDGSTSKDGLGGYHGSFFDSKRNKIYYSVIAYSDKSNGINFTKNSVDNITITASHEWTEAVTDPDVGNGKLGWYDYNYGEVADIVMSADVPLSQTYGKVDGYYVQKEWSNADKRFEVVAKK